MTIFGVALGVYTPGDFSGRHRGDPPIGAAATPSDPGRDLLYRRSGWELGQSTRKPEPNCLWLLTSAAAS